MRLWLGIATFLLGAGFWLLGERRARYGALRPLGLGVGALGLATLASTQPGLGWSISAIAFSVIAIVLLAGVLRDSLRR